MRGRIMAVVAVVALAASAVVVAVASTSANGLPSYTNGYAKWTKLNAKPIRGGSSAHAGTKNVFASRRRVRSKFPNGTVVVKTIARAGDRAGMPSQLAVMRKVNGRWRYVEFELTGSRYRALDLPQTLCSGCHVQARANDYVFTE